MRARRLFQLAEREELRFKYLNNFENALNQTEKKFGWLNASPVSVTSFFQMCASKSLHGELSLQSLFHFKQLSF